MERQRHVAELSHRRDCPRLRREAVVFRNPDSFHETDLRPGIHSQWMRCQWLGDRLLPVGQQRPIREEGVGWCAFGKHGRECQAGGLQRFHGQFSGQSDAESFSVHCGKHGFLPHIV